MPGGDRSNEFVGLFFLFVTLYVGLSLATYTISDPPASAAENITNWGGAVGAHLAYYCWTGLGWMSVFVVLALLVCAGQSFLHREGLFRKSVVASWLLVTGSGAALLSQLQPLNGGVVGTYLLDRLVPYIGELGTTLTFTFLIVLGLSYHLGEYIRETGTHILRIGRIIGNRTIYYGGAAVGAVIAVGKWIHEKTPENWVPEWAKLGPEFLRSEEQSQKEVSAEPVEQPTTSELADGTGNGEESPDETPESEPVIAEALETNGNGEETIQPAVAQQSNGDNGSNGSNGSNGAEKTEINRSPDRETVGATPGEKSSAQTEDEDPSPVEVSGSRPDVDEADPNRYELPSTEIFSPGDQEEAQPDDELLQDFSRRLEETFDEFNIDAEVVRVNPGPVVTMYEVEPGPGVSVKKIEKRADDIKLSLAVESVRIVSPIPGKQAVGIEVPNPERALVTLRDVLGTEEFQAGNGDLSLGLGLNVFGDPLVVDLADLPHLLVAGATGSGKSVCLNSIISSLVFQHDPWELKFVMVDPKRVELKFYDGLPHLMTPVIDDPSRATKVLNWAVEEMERRYEILSEAGKRDIRSYNEDRSGEDQMPYLVVIVDELADLMFTNKKQCEESIQRLAQMARAVGIHMVLATQRPSTDVITGIIKANMPARLAFRVSSGTDSRVILGQNGAETLLGDGDLLYLSADSPQPRRAQGSFVGDEETKDLIRFIKEQVGPSYVEEDNLFETSSTPLVNEDFDDEYYDQAKELVVREGKGSASMIQRQFRVGYNRAARMLDMMEEEGIVGPHRGSKAREVLVSEEDLGSGVT